MWVGFVVPVKYGECLWGNKTIKAFLIDVGYYLAILSVASIFWCIGSNFLMYFLGSLQNASTLFFIGNVVCVLNGFFFITQLLRFSF